MELNEKNVKSFRLDHLGIVAGVCEELKIEEKINKLIVGNGPRRIVKCGKAVVAMILNGLGFVGKSLYMTPTFFENLPVQRLLGENITAQNLNDDTLGKALDEISDYGATELFANIALEIACEHKLMGNSAHLDSTSMSMEGEYNNQESGTINITHGFAKQRPDLKQFIVQMIVTGPADLPIWHETLDGNTSDKTSFSETIQTVEQFKSELLGDHKLIWIADSALYSVESILQLKTVSWISRVPENIKEAKTVISKHYEDSEWIDYAGGYKYITHKSTYGDVEQRWLLVHSKDAYKREEKTFNKNLEKKHDVCKKELWHIGNQEFCYQKDAENAIKKIEKKHPFFSITYECVEELKYAKKGRPSIKNPPIGSVWHIKTAFQKNEEAIKKQLNTKGRFILATNDLDKAHRPDDSIIKEYKEQQSVEKGFRFLKDPWFINDKIFLKSKKRIEALSMVMTLCLLVYNYAQYFVRNKLKEQNEFLPNQLGKPVQNPTMRWIFQMMTGIAIVKVVLDNDFIHELVSNMNELRFKILTFFGPLICIKYGIP